MVSIKQLIFSIILIVPSLTNTLYIIVPGTWSSYSSWPQPGSDFFDTLEERLQEHEEEVFTFNWSGKNLHEARYRAAYNLANLIDQFEQVTLVTHSHGTNVAILASHILDARKSTTIIDTIYAFATPVSLKDYFPNMDIIKRFYNIFSFADPVQTILGTFERVYPEHPHIANVCIKINDKEPGHSDIHNVTVAYWLPQLQDIIPHNAHGILRIYDDQPPQYDVDETFQDAIELDRWMQYHLSTAFWKRKQQELK